MVTSSLSDQLSAARLCLTSKNVFGNAFAHADVAFLSRPFVASEATSTDGVNYYCTIGSSNETIVQTPAALDALVLIAEPGGFAANCLKSLPGGGLTLDQIRWIYSNYSVKQLTATGWSPSALPNSDNSDLTHYWSELCQIGTNCSSFCPSHEIDLLGPPYKSETGIISDLLAFLVARVLTDAAHGENLAFSRLFHTSEPGVVTEVNADPYSLGLVDFALYTSNGTFAASVQGTDSNYYAPCQGTLQNELYPLARPIYMDVRSDEIGVLSEVLPFLKFVFSQTGDSLVFQYGFVPLASVDKVTSYSRLGGGSRRRSRQLSPSSVKCGPPGPITATGDPGLYELATGWASLYSTFCNQTVITVTKSSNDIAALHICRDVASGSIADVALMTRTLNSSEATFLSNGLYRCIKAGNHRPVTELMVATEGSIMKYKKIVHGAASDCIDSLGGLTLDQIRWVYSSFNTSQLIATGWNPKSVPNDDNDEETHLWSELGGANCPATEIRIAGPPGTSDTTKLFSDLIFSSSSETISLTRPLGYFSGLDPSCPNGYPQGNPDAVTQYINTYSDAIGLFDFTADLSNLLNFDLTSRNLYTGDLSTAAAIKNSKGVAVYATPSTLSDCTYPLCKPYYVYLNHEFLSFQNTIPWLQFGYSDTGDAVVEAVGLNPISTATKTMYLNTRLVLPSVCFAETVLVEVVGKGILSIKNLRVGDVVMIATGKFAAVYSWAHYDPLIEVEYLQIHALGVARPLEITSQHMLYVNGEAVPASVVAVGANLTLASGGVAQVLQVTKVIRRGAYAPFTMSGTIAVNNVAASVYANLQGNTGFLTLGGFETPISMQFLAHLFQSPHRLLCKICFKMCQQETRDNRGISTWVATPLAAAEWLVKQDTMVMASVLVPTILLASVVFAVEAVLSNKVLLLLGMATLWLFRVHRNVRKR
jgi:ABC-type phosphate transport system substrate-binding protein